MIKKLLFIFFCAFSMVVFSQESLEEILAKKNDSILQSQKEIDSIVYTKNTKIDTLRTFKAVLKDKYSDKEFTYIDDVKEAPKKKKSTPNLGFLSGFAFFMTNIFPFLLGLIVVLIILKAFLGSETGFWNFKKLPKKITEKLVYEEEDINETDFDTLLNKAITNKNYRLATRYYYLSLLKKLTDKKHIEYHKDKTNSEYLFEIENKEIRNQFSYVSYIYSYVWYGEFPVDEAKFVTIQNKYQSFLKTIH